MARQTDDWAEVAALLAEASQQGTVPYDPVEWLPFIQASAILGDVERFQEITSVINDDFVRQQACDILLGMELTPEMRTLAEGSYCLPQ